MRVLETQGKGAGGEIQLTDAMAAMIGRQAFHAVTFDGVRYDRGSTAGYIQANLSLALERPDMADEVRAFAIDLLKSETPAGRRTAGAFRSVPPDLCLGQRSDDSSVRKECVSHCILQGSTT